MNLSRRSLAGLLLGALVGGAQAQPSVPSSHEVRWVASWAAAPQDYQLAPPTPGASPAPGVPWLAGRTWRQRLQPTLGGKRARIRFSNVFGKQPLRIAGASLGRSTGGAAVSPGTLTPLRFGGRGQVTIAPGAETWSDPVSFEVDPAQVLAVSFEVAGPAPFATAHNLPVGATASVPGAAALRARWADAMPSAWNHVVTGLDVANASAARMVVAFGDSITEGAGATDAGGGLPSRYPELLALRLRGRHGTAGAFGVVNAGISGNRLLADGVGPRGIERFQRDVLGQSGITHALILIGINDIGFSQSEGGAVSVGLPTPEQITAGLQRLIDQARDKGVKVLLGTLTPFKGAAYWNEEKEARRQAVNRWIRGRQDVDAVVDFDAALRDPADPLALNPKYDSGDRLHPGNAGYAAMAGAIDLRELRE